MGSVKTMFIFGENHQNSGNVQHIANRIRQIKPDYILHELLYADRCFTKETIEHRLKNCKDGELCDPRINKDIYKLGLDLGAKLVGIDLDDPEIAKLSMKDQFHKREKHMLRLIRGHFNKDRDETVVVVVGDTHLRETETRELGDPSPIMSFAKEHPEITVERAPTNLQEVA